MDHFFQIPGVGEAEEPMLDGYTFLGFAAGLTTRVNLQLTVTGVTYRHPGLLAKIVTSLDVLSGGRATLGIGAAWFEREHDALGVPFPPVAERFEMLDETLRICRQMWSDDDGPFEGAHFRLAETMNSPQCVSRPHPPIMIGGLGERKTLKLVARHAQAANLFPIGESGFRHKLDVLRSHCDDEGTDFDVDPRHDAPPGPRPRRRSRRRRVRRRRRQPTPPWAWTRSSSPRSVTTRCHRSRRWARGSCPGSRSSELRFVRTDDLDYDLPDAAIAQSPIEPRDAARLLVDNGPGLEPDHRHVSDLPSLVRPGDVVVVNDTRVLPARVADRASERRVRRGAVAGARATDGWWEALCRPSRKLARGLGRRRRRGRPAVRDGRGPR